MTKLTDNVTVCREQDEEFPLPFILAEVIRLESLHTVTHTHTHTHTVTHTHTHTPSTYQNSEYTSTNTTVKQY